MSVVFRLDTSGFDRAIKDYSVATGKTLEHAANRTIASLAIKGQAETKTASQSEIRALESKPYWPKVIAKALGGRARARFADRRAASGARAMKTGRRARKVRYTPAYKIDSALGRHYSSQAHRYSQRIIRSRLGRVRFVRFFFSALAREAQRYVKSGFTKPTKAFSGFRVHFHPATRLGNHMRAFARVVYDFRKRGARTAAGVEAILQDVLNRIAPMQLRDMTDYTNRRMAELSRQYSARAA